MTINKKFELVSENIFSAKIIIALFAYILKMVNLWKNLLILIGMTKKNKIKR